MKLKACLQAALDNPSDAAPAAAHLDAGGGSSEWMGLKYQQSGFDVPENLGTLDHKHNDQEAPPVLVLRTGTAYSVNKTSVSRTRRTNVWNCGNSLSTVCVLTIKRYKIVKIFMSVVQQA